MKKAGIGLIALGFYCVLFAFNMDVVVGTTYNIGLMNERQNVVYLSGIIFLAGIMLFGFGFSAKEESKNLKTFAMACFLSPVLLLVGIKTVVSMRESIKQEQIRKQNAIDAEAYKKEMLIHEQEQAAELRRKQAEEVKQIELEKQEIEAIYKKNSVVKKILDCNYNRNDGNTTIEFHEYTDCPYFFDLYENNIFKESFVSSINEKKLKEFEWIARGTSSPVSVVNINGTLMFISSVCEPHNCPNEFFIAYDIKHKLTFGIYTPSDENQDNIIFGNPSPEVKSILDRYRRRNQM